jgi:hypothetical protein
MNKAIEILQLLLVPKLEMDARYDKTKVNAAFWERFVIAFLDYESDKKPVYALLYSLELENVEKLFDKLPKIHSHFIKELAENYVLGNSDNATTHLIATKNPTFLARVSFFQTLEQVIKKVERKNIKSNLPKSFERLTFKVSDIELENVTKKIGRENLKSKFKEWDNELQHTEESVILYSTRVEKQEKIPSQSHSKVISLSWIKYAVAACFVLGGGIWFYKFSTPEIIPIDNGVVLTEKDTVSKVVPKTIIEEPIEAIAYNTKVSENIVQYPSDLGFTASTNAKSIIITLKDASQFIAKLESEITKQLNQERPGNEPMIKALKIQLDKLTSQQGGYEFNGKELIIYTNDLKVSYTILSQDDKAYFIKKNTDYYPLYFTKTPLKFTKVKDDKLIEQLEKISFENE